MIAGLLLVLSLVAQDDTARDLRALMEEVSPALVTIESITQVEERTGRLRDYEEEAFGVIVDGRGTILTEGTIYIEAPRFSKPRNIVVTLSSGEKVGAEFLGKDDATDLAFLRLAPREEPTPFVDFSRSAEVSPGDPVVVFGILPESYDHARKFTLTRVSALVTKPNPLIILMDDTTDSISGPAFGLDGRPVGLISSSSRSRILDGKGVILPGEAVLRAIRNPPRPKVKESKGWLGISYQVLNPKLAEMLGIPGRTGVVVSRVYPGMPAGEGGVRVDDAILSINGESIPASLDEEDSPVFADIIKKQEVGVAIPLAVWRGGREMELRVTPQERPESPNEADRYRSEALGLTVRDITFFDRVDLRLDPDEKGVIVQAVEPALPAGLAQVRVDDIVKEVSGNPVVDVGGFRERVEEARQKDLILFVRRDHQTKFLRVR